MTTIHQTTTTTESETVTMSRAELEAKLAAARDEGATKAMISEWEFSRQQDEKARRDPVLRVQMTRLIDALDELVRDTAADLHTMRGGDILDTFEIDRIADVVLWQLIEFLNQAEIDRDPDSGSGYDTMAKSHQLTTFHAGGWFDTSDESSGIVVFDRNTPPRGVQVSK